MVYKSTGAIPQLVLSLANRLCLLSDIVLDLYNKSRMMGDYHVRFCERLGVEFPLLTRPDQRCRQFKISTNH